MKLSSLSSLYSFLFVFIIFLIIYYVNTKPSLECDCDYKKKEGMINSNISSGSVRGYIKRQIHPIKRKIKNNFIGTSTLDYYSNKLNQIFR